MMNHPDNTSSLKYPWAKPYLDDFDRNTVADVLHSGWISDGEYINKFEKIFAESIQAEHALTCSSGTSALLLSLLAVGIERGDEVLVPGYGFAGAANMVLSLGAKPVFIDVSFSDWCMDYSQLDSHVTAKTKAIIVIHNYGVITPMPSIISFAKRHNIKVIEDCAEALFSTQNNIYAGCFGDVGCFSFQAAKTLACGEGGMVVTHSQELRDRMHLLKNHGMKPSRRYYHEVVGHNFRLTNFQAALGYSQLLKREFICTERQRITDFYRDYFEAYTGITFQVAGADDQPVFWANALLLADDLHVDRDDVIQQLIAKGIETRPGFETFDKMPPYDAPRLPIAHKVSTRVLCLPTYIELNSEDLHTICEEVKQLVVPQKSYH